MTVVARFWNEDGVEMPALYRDDESGELRCTWNYLLLVAPDTEMLEREVASRRERPDVEPDKLIRFDVQTYGDGGGVMAEYPIWGESAEEVAKSEAERLSGTMVATVGVWAHDRKSGTAQAKVAKK